LSAIGSEATAGAGVEAAYSVRVASSLASPCLSADAPSFEAVVSASLAIGVAALRPSSTTGVAAATKP